MNNGINTFHKDTPQTVKMLLQSLNYSKRRVRIWYGDAITGKSWNEEYDVIGTIGRSRGPAKIPLIIPNRRSSGGPAILDHCIIRIDDTVARRTLYKHSNFHTGLKIKLPTTIVFDILKQSVKERIEVIDTIKDTIIARFDHPFKAHKYIEFMEGKRYSK